jgi:hypothetical protein
MKRAPPSRFRDPKSDYLEAPALVVCPRCAGPAIARDGAVICNTCSFSRLPLEDKFTARPIALVHTKWVPRCVSCGTGLPKVARRTTKEATREVAIKCPMCEAVATYPVRARPIVVSPSHDPETGLPYFLTIPFRTNTLWARNLEHLNAIEAYIAATLRERNLKDCKKTWFAKLPTWIKASSNRAALLKLLQQLRASLPVNLKKQTD